MTNEQRIDWMKERLIAAFNPSFLVIHDLSHKHEGHEGAKGGAGHFSLEITATQFENVSLIIAHRMIYEILASAIPSEIHALKIKIRNE